MSDMLGSILAGKSSEIWSLGPVATVYDAIRARRARTNAAVRELPRLRNFGRSGANRKSAGVCPLKRAASLV